MTAAFSEKAREFLRGRRFGALATINRNGTPQLTAMWYLLEEDTIVMNTKASRTKERNMRRDPRISLCVLEGYSYITVSGTVEIIDDQEIAQKDIYRLAVRYNGEEAARRQMEQQFSKEQRVTLRLKCERVIEEM